MGHHSESQTITALEVSYEKERYPAELFRAFQGQMSNAGCKIAIIMNGFLNTRHGPSAACPNLDD